MTHTLQRHRQSRRVRLEFSVEDGNLPLTGDSDDLLKEMPSMFHCIETCVSLVEA